MTDNWKYQASPNIAGTLFNIRGENADEFEANLLDFPLGAVVQLIANLRGAEGLAPVVHPVTPASPPAPQPQAAPQQQQTPYGRRKASATTGGRGGRSERLAPDVVPEPCHHGPRTFRDGNGAKGYWSAYFCPSPKGTPDQCDPLWVDND